METWTVDDILGELALEKSKECYKLEWNGFVAFMRKENGKVIGTSSGENWC